MTIPVIRDEKTNMIALAVRTALRAEETPVIRETTTKILSGTRKRDESCKQTKNKKIVIRYIYIYKFKENSLFLGKNLLLLDVRWR